MVAAKIPEPVQVGDAHANYDAVFKDAMSLFKDKALGFFGLPDNVRIKEPLRTEKKEVRVSTEFSDLTFRLSDGRGFHAEEQVDLTKDDLLRFCGYHVDLVREYECEFITAIFLKNPSQDVKLDIGMLKFEPYIVDCSMHDADEILESMKEKVQKGEPVNELEIIYLPLFKSARHTPVDLLHEAVTVIRQMKAKDEDQKLKMIALALMVSNKFVSKAELNKLWEDAKMVKLKILELAEEKGIEQGIDISAEIMLALIQKTPVEEIAERYKVSVDKIEQLQQVLTQRTA